MNNFLKIYKDIDMQGYTSFATQVFASDYTRVFSQSQLADALKMVQKRQMPFLILGGGSNILFTKNYEGLVIDLELTGIKIEKTSAEQSLVKVAASENWHQLVVFCLENNLYGLENLSLIPGKVGASPIQNIGAYGVEVKDRIASITCMNTQTQQIEIIDNASAQFGYRDSIFKQNKNKYVVLEVSFLLDHTFHPKLEYGAIKDQLAAMNIQNPTAKDVAQAVINIRQSKLPDPKITPNAGSFFKNPTVLTSVYQDLKEKHPTLPNYPQANGVKLPAAWLIEQAGFKGKIVGHVGSHAQQALVIINPEKKASGSEILAYAQSIIAEVKAQFGITLEPEVNII